MLALALAVSCSLAIGMIFKHTGRKGMDRMALLAANYGAAMLLGLVMLGGGPLGATNGVTAAGGLVPLGVTTGALFICGFFILSVATDVAGMSLAIGVMRVSVVIPFLASWWIWEEVPSPAQGAGLVLAGVAFFLIARKERPPVNGAAGAAGAKVARAAPKRSAFLVLALLFLVGGIIDTFLKTFDEVYAAAYPRAVFLLMVFGVAFVIGAAYVVVRGVRSGQWPRGATLLWGVLLGLVNYGSADFLLRAIDQLSGPFVFPANNIAVVIGGALLGVFFWDEHLTRVNWIGLLMAAAALALLNL